MKIEKNHKASCHCGAVQFELDGLSILTGQDTHHQRRSWTGSIIPQIVNKLET